MKGLSNSNFRYLTRALATLSLLSGLILLLINIYGLNQELRPAGLVPEVLRFGENDLSLSPLELSEAIRRLPTESDTDFAKRLTMALSKGIAHVEWERYDPDLFHQRVPVWENYLLYFVGVATSIPEFQRYHFANPYRSLERGIGICGDASMTLSGLLDEQGIENKIITVPGHVMVQAKVNSQLMLLDADFGVVLDQGIAFYQQHPQELIKEYQQQLGRVNDGELMIAGNLSKNGFSVWDGTAHFITNKYYFEKFAYWIKWPLPIVMIMAGIWAIRQTQKKR